MAKNSGGSNDNNNYKNVYRNYKFRVFVGETQIAFSKISNIEAEREIEEFSVGGINNAPHIAAAPSKKSGRLILEKGLVLKDNDTVSKWRAGYFIKNPIQIFVMDDDKKHNFEKAYAIADGLITKWEIGSLDAMGSEILIQKFEIAHQGILASM